MALRVQGPSLPLRSLASAPRENRDSLRKAETVRALSPCWLDALRISAASSQRLRHALNSKR